MRCRFLTVMAASLWLNNPAVALEGPTVAGPIGGSDMSSAVLPPPGLYGGLFAAASGTLDFHDGEGHTVPALRDAHLRKQQFGPFFLYVPDVKVLGGAVGVSGFVAAGNQCGSLFIGQDNECEQGLGDPYLEVDWSRSFGFVRPSRDPGAYPILQGLSVLFGFGTVFPSGTYDDDDRLEQVLSMGTNIWDFALTVALTYTTAPILAEGTEFSAKLYWNQYLENPASHHWTGDVMNVDFAITEHIGRFQVGVSGFYGWQADDDELFGVPIEPDGLRATALVLGPVVKYDLPEYSSVLKAKFQTNAIATNATPAWVTVVAWSKKF
ncbi:SphA family protein [Methyloceanibacter caenitepidi]|nr:transporter [Methyloceanibacter caenitepidi]